MGRRAFDFSPEHLALLGKIPDIQLARLAKCSAVAVANKRKARGIPLYSGSTPAAPAAPIAATPPVVLAVPEVKTNAYVTAALKSAVPAQGGMLMPFDQYALLAREFLA